MVNLAVINLKTVIKKSIKYIAIFLGILMIFKIFGFVKTQKDMEQNPSKWTLHYQEIIDSNLFIAQYMHNQTVKKESNLKKLLVSELTVFASEEELMEAENQEEATEFTNTVQEVEQADVKEESKVEVADTMPTKVMEANNKIDKFTNVYGSVKIKNESQYTLTEDMLVPNVDFINKKDIIIYHTHTCESYTPTENNPYEASGNFRTTDLNYSVAKVGTELTNFLKQAGFEVIHDMTYHDYPAYTGSYTRSLSTITGILNQHPNAQLVIDLHRDALGSNSSYAPAVQIGEETAAQVMFVMGTDGGGLEHPNWLNNFKLAIKIQEKANQMYPGLFKPIILRDSRYNQHVTSGACIIEVGATGNTLEQCNTSMKYLANVFAEVMQ